MTIASGGARQQSNILIGERIHTLMWRAGRTQSQLAGLLGVDQGSISRRLHGQREWSAVEVAITAAWLAVTPEELMPEIELMPDDGGAPSTTRTYDLRIISPSDDPFLSVA